MRNYSFQFEVERLVTMFISAMDDIVIKRYNVHKNARDQIRVRFVYAPKQRVLHDLLNKAQSIQLPVAAVSIGGINRDNNRVFNKIAGSNYLTTDPRSQKKLPQPVPIDLTLNLSFLTRYQSDMDQCISNFLPYCDPYFVISWRVPEMPDYEIRSKVEWSGSVNFEYPNDLNSTQVARVRADTTFIMKGWMFKSFPKETDGEILTIKTDYSTLQELTSRYSLDSLDEDTTKRVSLSAFPQPKSVDVSVIPLTSVRTVNIFGSSFINVKNVYLSGTAVTGTSSYNPFGTNPKLSSAFPSFQALKLPISSFNVSNDNQVTLITPYLTTPGIVDFIVENDAGYGSLITHARHNTYIPLSTSSPLYSSYVPYNPPFLSGVRVR